MKVTALFILAFLGIASAGKLGHHHGHDIPSFSQDSGTASSFGDRQSTLFEHSSGQGQPGLNQFGRVSEPSVHTSKSLIELDVRVEGFVTFDNHHGIFRGGVLQGFGEKLAIGESGQCTVQGTGIFDDGQTSSLEEGLLNVRKISVTDRQAIQTALSHTGVTVDQFIQQTGNIALQHCAYEIIAGTMIIDGVPNNIIGGIYIITSVGLNDDKPITGSGIDSGTASSFGDRQSTLFESSSGQGKPGLNQFGRVSEPSVHTSKSLIEVDVTVEGFVIFDNYHGIFRGGVFQGIGVKIANGEIAHDMIFRGTGTFDNGHTCSIEEGSLTVRKISLTNRQALQTALSHTGVTVDQFIQQTGNIALKHCAYEIISGTMIIDGVPNNIIAGIFIISSVGENDEKPFTGSGISPGVGSGDLVQTVTVTETAAFQTQIITEAVTLTKRQTIDTFVTVTAPNYASILVTVTNIVKQTGTVSEEEVIRSPVAGVLIVNTVPVSSQTVVNVRAKTTNYFVQTVTEHVSLPQTHFVTIHSLSTITVNNPVKSTVVQAITQTQVLTVTKTSIVNSTVYTTGTTTITIGTGGGTTQTTTSPGGYY